MSMPSSYDLMMHSECVIAEMMVTCSARVLLLSCWHALYMPCERHCRV
jgi:hypothetical protein